MKWANISVTKDLVEVKNKISYFCLLSNFVSTLKVSAKIFAIQAPQVLRYFSHLRRFA